jgi:hypothetical protein
LSLPVWWSDFEIAAAQKKKVARSKEDIESAAEFEQGGVRKKNFKRI